MVSSKIVTPRCGDRGKTASKSGGTQNVDLKKGSSNLLFEGSACFLAGHSRFNLATARVITSSNSSYCADCGDLLVLSLLPSLEDDSLCAKPTSWG